MNSNIVSAAEEVSALFVGQHCLTVRPTHAPRLQSSIYNQSSIYVLENVAVRWYAENELQSTDVMMTTLGLH